jgi:hypothetical protein
MAGLSDNLEPLRSDFRRFFPELLRHAAAEGSVAGDVKGNFVATAALGATLFGIRLALSHRVVGSPAG